MSVYNVQHSVSKMIDFGRNDSEEDYKELRERLLAEMPEALERYHPLASCPACGSVPGGVRASHRADGLKRGMVWGLVVGIVVAFAGLGLPGPMWAYPAMGLVGGPALGSLAGWLLSDRLFLRRDIVFTKDEWEKRLAGSKSERLALMKALRHRR